MVPINLIDCQKPVTVLKMAALFQCFRRKGKSGSKERNNEKCVCNKVNQVLKCGHCKSALIGYWEPSYTTDGADGGGCSKMATEMYVCVFAKNNVDMYLVDILHLQSCTHR